MVRTVSVVDVEGSSVGRASSGVEVSEDRVVNLVVGDVGEGAGKSSVACSFAEAELEFRSHVVLDLVGDRAVD